MKLPKRQSRRGQKGIGVDIFFDISVKTRTNFIYCVKKVFYVSNSFIHSFNTHVVST